MALKFRPDKRKGARKRTTIDPRRGGKAGDAGPKFQREGKQSRTNIDPRIGGTKGDAGFAGKAGKSGLGVAPGNAIAKAKRAKNRTTIDPRIGGQKGDAGFAGKKKSIAPGSFKEAFAVAFAKKPGGTFTYKGKKYLAARKGQGKGPSKNRVEDKSITAANMVKGKRDTTKPKTTVKVPSGFGLDTKKKRKTTNAAGQKLGQRKAGGQIKKYVAGGAVATLSKAIKKAAMKGKAGKPKNKMAMGGMTMKDVPMDKKKSLGALPEEVRNKMGFNKAGGKVKMMKEGGTPGDKIERRIKGRYPKYNDLLMRGKPKPIQRPKLPKMGDKPKATPMIDPRRGGKKAGGMAKKKMMGGGMAMKYKHGGMTKKCPRDGIARKGKTRA